MWIFSIITKEWNDNGVDSISMQKFIKLVVDTFYQKKTQLRNDKKHIESKIQTAICSSIIFFLNSFFGYTFALWIRC